jgi:PelA/Pel-15E family pectate lyase
MGKRTGNERHAGWRLFAFCYPAFLLLAVGGFASGVAADDRLEAQRVSVRRAMRQAASYFYGQVAVHGGYVYHYSPDLKTRWGEGLAGPEQIWVQPPATPTVGMAYLTAFRATQDPFYLQAAEAVGQALLYGQLRSGGWRNMIDFQSRARLAADYRNGRGNPRGSNASSLDDGQTQTALRFLMQLDQALEFRQPAIHEAVEYASQALLAAQFPSGGFPQVFTGAVPVVPPRAANYPDYDWKTEGKIKNYWEMYTLNDNQSGYLAELLQEGYRIYADERYRQALAKLGDFLISSQMPEPQPGWAQQYNFTMQPIWARKFEPPAIAGRETEEAIETLMLIHAVTGDARYLEPIPAALAWLQRSQLNDGFIARYYELQTNRPLYMRRAGEDYRLTYEDADLPGHYGWKTVSRVVELQARWRRRQSGQRGAEDGESLSVLTQAAAQIVDQLDPQGRWLSTYAGERLVGQPRFRQGEEYLSSERFSRHLTTLAQFLEASAE